MSNQLIIVDQEAKQIIYENFRYQRTSKNGKSYRCCIRTCKAGGSLDNGLFKRNGKIHANHAEMSQIEIDKLLKVKELKKVAETDQTIKISASYTKCYSELATKYPAEELAEVLKPCKNVKSTMYYHINKSKPASSVNINDIEINETYQSLFDKRFLQYDNKNNNNRILIFISYIGFKILFGSKRWHFDGTFKASPNFFKQILTIHGL
ncbi:unnamed protein product [Brachionus calyciflorus]|uniref:FLYWCH-type domain-containing protein n=1 Tax=Brachionus calyciflorus TaxID=104777 RepID=A0A814LRC7_9BILA|nr:unnamed protein product [Brachionus calyciflorus]